MALLSLGINHLTAPVDIREKVAFDQEGDRGHYATHQQQRGNTGPEGNKPSVTNIKDWSKKLEFLRSCYRLAKRSPYFLGRLPGSDDQPGP